MGARLPFPPRLFRERLSQLRVRLEEVGAERAPEYTEPLGGLQRSLKIRIQVAGLWPVLCPVPLREPTALCPLPLSPVPCLAGLCGQPGPWPSPAAHHPPSAGIYKGFCLDVIRNKYECELQGAKQHLEVNVGVLGLKFSHQNQVHNQVATGKADTSFMNFSVNLFSIGLGVSFYL